MWMGTVKKSYICVKHLFFDIFSVKHMNNQADKQECCPPFNPSPWQEKSFTWKDKLFVKDKVFTLFNIPINFGQVIKRIMKNVDSSGAKALDWMALSNHTSKWNMDLYVAVDKEVAKAENVKLSGEFLSKVYEGDFRQTGTWCKDFENYVSKKGSKVKKWFMWYTTCPKCAKKYGKNYVVIVGQVN